MRVLASHLWIVAALLSVVMISCGREEPEEQKKPEDFDVNEWENTDIDGDATMSAVPIEFNIENTGEVMRGVTPFNGEGYVFSSGDRITIELTRNGVATQKVYKVATVVTDPLEFDYDYDPTGLPFYWETKDDIQMRAWSYGNSTPYTTDPVGNPFILNTDQREVTSGKDNYKELLYSPQQTYGYSSSIPIKLYHQLTRLTINLTHEASGDLSVSQVTIGNSSLPTTATFNETGINIPSSYVGSWAGYSSATGQVIARADVANQKYSAVLFPNTYTAGNKIVNVKTSDNNTYAYELPSGGVTLNAGKQYNYTITVKDNNDLKNNPLWWMAQYNMNANGVMATAHTAAAGQPVWSFANAKNITYSGYHQPTLYEMASVFPSNSETVNNTSLHTLTGTADNPSEFAEIRRVIGGVNVAASTSVIYKAGTTEFYAIRFVGTKYVSAWHYTFLNSPCKGYLLESYLLDDVSTLQQAKSKLKTIASSSVWKTFPATSANQRPEDLSYKPNCYVQRFMGASGNNASGGSTSNRGVGAYVYIWTSTAQPGGAAGWGFNLHFNTANNCLMHVINHNNSVRLFKNP